MRKILALLVLTGISLFPLHARAMTISPDGNSAELSVMTYNLWGAPVGGKKVKGRFPEIAKHLATLDVDIVALQEVFDGCFVATDEPKIILRGTRFPFYTKGPSREAFPHCLSSGVIILSKFPIIESAALIYRNCAGLDCMAKKGVLYARIRVPSIGDVDVYTTHVNANAHANVRIKQSKQAIEFVRLHSGDGLRPVVFMGDLNGDPEDAEITHLRNELALHDSHQEYVESHPVSQVEYNGFTIDPLRNGNLTHSSDQTRHRIDYIFFREPTQSPAPIEIAHSHMMFEEPAYRGRALSDHFGVRTYLNMPILAKTP